ncbi:MAG: matrixin family metalloprotease, partial [Planctomycetota bacterium]
ITTLNATYNALTGIGLHLVLVTDPIKASIILENAVHTVSGGKANGLLGNAELWFHPSSSGQHDDGHPYLQFSGYATVEMVEGWNWYAGSNPAGIGPGQYDYQTVVTHELGHAVGLYHDSNSYALLNDGYDVMYPALAAGVIRRNLSAYDSAWLLHLYAHGVDPGTNGHPESADGLHIPGFVPADDLPPVASSEPASPGEAVPLPTAAESLGNVPGERLAGPAITAPPATLAANALSTAAHGRGLAFLFTVPANGIASEAAPATAALVGPRSAASRTAISVPADSPQETPLRSSQNARLDSGGDENLLQSLEDDSPAPSPAAEDELPAAEPALRTEEALSAAALPRFGEAVVPAIQESRGICWREASTIYFTEQASAGDSAERCLPASRLVAPIEGSAGSPRAVAAALVLGSYWNFPSREVVLRERASMARKRRSR